jgi:hypothetical protein
MAAYQDVATGKWYNKPPEFGGKAYATRAEAEAARGPVSVTAPATKSATVSGNLAAIPPATSWSRGSSGSGGGGSSGGSGAVSNSALADAVQRRIQEHIVYFGSPEAYMEAIVKKIGGGAPQPLTDPEAAYAFMRQNPDLFKSAATGWSKLSPEVEARRAYERQVREMQDMFNQALKNLTSITPQLPPIQPVVQQPAQPVAPQQPAQANVPPPPGVTSEPKVEGISQRAPEAQVQEKLPEGVRRGTSGFEYAVSPAATVPSVDDLLKIYHDVFGTSTPDEYVRHYLASPQFQRVLGGSVPMWMATDPLWSQYLRRLGLLGEAAQRRLTSQ